MRTGGEASRTVAKRRKYAGSPDGRILQGGEAIWSPDADFHRSEARHENRAYKARV